MQEDRKWMVEMQSDGESDAFRILETSGNQATLKYIAMDEVAADELVCALNWMDTFHSGTIPGDPKPKAKRAPRKKREALILQLELDPPKPPRKPKA